MTNEPAVLTAEAATEWLSDRPRVSGKAVDAMCAIESGQTTVIPTAKLREQESELERLRARLEITSGHIAGYDGIAARDETIRRLEKRVAELESGEDVPAAWRYSIAGEIRYATTLVEAQNENATKEPEDRWIEPLFLGPQRMTEAQAREAFDRYYAENDYLLHTDSKDYYCDVYLAALRHANVIPGASA